MKKENKKNEAGNLKFKKEKHAMLVGNFAFVKKTKCNYHRLCTLSVSMIAEGGNLKL